MKRTWQPKRIPRLRKHGFRFVGPTTVYAAMQACGVVNDHVAACHVRDEVERLGAGALEEEIEHSVRAFDGIDGETFEFELARLDLRKVENVVDDGEQALAGARNHFRVATRARRQFSRGEKLRHHEHAVHRRANFVAHVGQERALGPISRVSLFTRFA